MDNNDITVEEQKRHDRELTEKALKGADIVRVMIVLQIIGIAYRFITVDEPLVFRSHNICIVCKSVSSSYCRFILPA